MGSRGKKMVEMSLQRLNCSTAVADIATTDSNNDFYVMEPEKELLDIINALDESPLENFDNTIMVMDVPTYIDEHEDNNNWEVVNRSQISNTQDIEGVTHNMIINEETGNGGNNESRNIHQDVASAEMIQGKEEDYDIEKQVETEIDVQSEIASNWESDLEGEHETENESSDSSENGGAVDRVDNSNDTGGANDDNNIHRDDAMNNEETETENAKKRKCADKTKWKRNLNKKLRMMGKNYLGFTRVGNTVRQNQHRSERKMGKRCESAECKRSSLRMCSDIIEDQRKSLFEMFWSDLSWDQRRIYVANNVVKTEPKRRYTSEPNSRRSHSFLYRLKINNNQYPVCKAMFLSTLGLGERSVREWVLKSTSGMYQSQEVALPKRKSADRNRKKDIDTLNKFFDDLPKLPSHYARKNTSKMFLEQKIESLTQLYNIYLERIEEEEPVTAKAVSRTKFTSVFREKNLSLYTLKKDQCDTCALHEVGNLTDQEWNEHVLKKELARKEKQNDKTLAEENLVTVLTMDLQAVKISPSIQANACYFKTKLTSHNFTVYNLASKHCKCYWFTEIDTDLTASTFASLIVNYLKTHCANDKEVIIYSDGCTYQNRNCIMANALLHYSINSRQTVIQKFLERGHTQMECDSVHSQIEKKLKNRPIYLPSNYSTATIEARKKPFPYEATWMDFNAFTNYSVSSLQKVNSIRPGAQKVTDIRALKYTPQEEIWYKTDFQQPWTLLPQRMKPLKNPPEWPKLHTEPRKISAVKYEHLQQLKLLLPKDCQPFYESLPHN